ncbi:MAG: PAS domain-containing sensor histidine kinase, partial [Vicingaceae bacterium]
VEDHPFNYKHFFELSPDLLCIASFDGYLKKVNASVPKLLGYTYEELYTQPINTFIHPDDREATTKVREALAKAKTLTNYENRYCCKNGAIIWLSWTSLPVMEEKLIFAIAKNVTHKKKIEAERNKELLRLTKYTDELKQLGYTTSHDLRSPLNSLLTVFDKIDLSKINDPRTVKLIEVSKKGGDFLKGKLDNYIETLSDQTKINTSIEEVDLKNTLEHVLKSIDSLVKEAKTDFNIDLSQLQNVAFNRAYMESIFLNLITNSIKYAKADVAPYITIHSKIDNGRKLLIYKDNGIGFDMEEVKDRIFGLKQKFTHHVDSKGIGLYLVYNHIRNLGGDIQVNSKVNEGSEFIITFKN